MKISPKFLFRTARTREIVDITKGILGFLQKPCFLEDHAEREEKTKMKPKGFPKRALEASRAAHGTALDDQRMVQSLTVAEGKRWF